MPPQWRLSKARTAVVNAAKERADATASAGRVIAEEARLVALIEPEEIRLKALRDAYDAEQERIKREAAQREKARIDAITERIQNARCTGHRGRSQHPLRGVLADCAVVIESFAEFRNRPASCFQRRSCCLRNSAAKVAAAEESARVKAEQAAAAAPRRRGRRIQPAEAIVDEQRRRARSGQSGTGSASASPPKRARQKTSAQAAERAALTRSARSSRPKGIASGELEAHHIIGRDPGSRR